GEGPHEAGLADAGDAFEQRVAGEDEAHQNAPDGFALPDDLRGDLALDRLDRRAELRRGALGVWLVRRRNRLQRLAHVHFRGAQNFTFSSAYQRAVTAESLSSSSALSST